MWLEFRRVLFRSGLGSTGLPGGSSAADRFVRIAWLRNWVYDTTGENDTIVKAYHMLQNVAKPHGTSMTEENEDEYTFYSSMMSLDNGHLYYNTYNNTQISMIDMFEYDLQGPNLIEFVYQDTFVPLKANLK